MKRPPPKRRGEVIAVQVNEGLVKAMNALAERQHRSRSDIIRQAALRELEANGLCAVT